MDKYTTPKLKSTLPSMLEYKDIKHTKIRTMNNVKHRKGMVLPLSKWRRWSKLNDLSEW